MTDNHDSERLAKTLEAFGPNSAYVWEILQDYLKNPGSVDASWQEYFLDIAGVKAPKPPPQGTPPQQPSADAFKLKGVAARIVENMEASLSLPTATSVRVIPAKVLEENRRLINQTLHGTRKISFTHIVAWAIVRAIEKFPGLNASFARVEGEPYRDAKAATNLGIAIDVTRKDGTRTLLVPNLKDAGNMDFSRFVESYNAIVHKAQTGTLEPADFQGTSLTLTNPGTVGTVMSMPRLMPGQGAIIAMGAIDFEAERQGMAAETLASLGVSKVMHMSCTYDHRIIQGAESGQFLALIHRLLQGEEKFYEQLFADLSIPFKPIAWSKDKNPPVTDSYDRLVERQASMLHLVNAYRVRGHLIARLDPLQTAPQSHSELDPAYHNLTIWDLDREFRETGIAGLERATLRDILDMLRETYCSSIGAEYMFIQDPVQKKWIQDHMEPTRNAAPLDVARKQRILEKLVAAEQFERFLHTKFIGHKRFSIEGGETFLPLLEMLLDGIADEGKRVVIGMAHRGRLNVLANIIGKPLEQMFNEFEENFDPLTTQGTGDVKYHLGARGVHKAPGGKEILVEVAPNPSHLEAVNPVVEGMVRAMQDRGSDSSRKEIYAILVHGDAAFAGQGIVPETLNLSQLDGYGTGGTIHVVINNQIGFTTSPGDARSSPYPTDVAKMVQAPIFHVNGDDPEAAIRVAMLALSYRQEFNRDVVIDLICYRKYGHNESDEPSYTQPLLYQKIKQHPSVKQLYAATLLAEGSVTAEATEKMEKDAHQRYEQVFEASRSPGVRFEPDIPVAIPTADLRSSRLRVRGGVTVDVLREVGKALTRFPEGFALHPKLGRFVEARRKAILETQAIDWATAESLAIGSLLSQGIRVRLSGQDSARGTFSQRHAILYDAVTGKEYVPLNHIRDGQALFSVYDSLLSEAAVLGFEFGYSVADPESLVLWEAQFGDFVNNAQVVIDQFIAASAARWQQPSDLVLLLPHGYEGQGPEHSSARLERFLQLAAEENMRVCYPSTPAQYYHLLRSQKSAEGQTPLVTLTPKSLLRNPLAISQLDELVTGDFIPVLEGNTPSSDVRRILLCSGKIAYDILEAQKKKGKSEEAIIRLEQLYPYPEKAVSGILAKYERAKEIFWVQEEPENMGAWTFLRPRLEAAVGGKLLRYVGRPASASPATGSLKLHEQNQKSILEEALA